MALKPQSPCMRPMDSKDGPCVVWYQMLDAVIRKPDVLRSWTVSNAATYVGLHSGAVVAFYMRTGSPAHAAVQNWRRGSEW